MANTISPTYSFTLPEVGADTNAWGGHINGNFTTIDNQMVSRTLTSAQTMLGALNLPSNGLNVGSGQLQVTGGNVSASGTFTSTGAITSVSNISGVNGSFSGTLTVTGVAALNNNTTVGGTFTSTGAATFSTTVTANFTPSTGAHLTNKTYVDAGDAARLPLAGGTMSGAITLAADPVSALQASTKQYVDNQNALKLSLTGGTMSGNITVQNTAPAVWLNDTNGYNFGLYNDANVCGIYRGAAAAWSFYSDTAGNFTSVGNITGVSGVLSGTLNVTGVATLSSNANVGGALGVTGLSSLNGGMSSTTGSFSSTLGVTGAATFSSTVSASTAPSAGAHLTNKTYVDGQIATLLPLTGGTMTGNITISNAAPQISLADTGGSGAYLRADGGIVGFLNSGASAWLHYVDQSGNFVAAGNVTAYSDARLKENVVTIRDALSITKRMRGVFYDKISTGEHGVGVIAQEMQEVLPQVVLETDGHLSVAYGNIVGVLIEAVKELSARVEALEGK